MSDSTHPGTLQPIDVLPPDDDAALDAVLQTWIVSLTGLPGSLVRPRWQPAPPPEPDQGTNWCAIGIMSQVPDANNWERQNPLGGGGLGDHTAQRHEELEALVTLYGPSAAGYAGLVQDNSQIDQNRALLDAHGIQLIGTGIIRIVPELINQIFVRRVDLSIGFRRQIDRTYAIRTLLTAQTHTTVDPT